MKKDAKDIQFDALIANGLLDEDDRIVGRILTRRQALLAVGATGLATLIGCGGSGGGSSSGTTGAATTGTTGTTTSTTGTSTTSTTATTSTTGTATTTGASTTGTTTTGTTTATTGTTATGSTTGTTAGGTGINLVATPSAIVGPFFIDEKLNRSDLTTGTTRTTVVNANPYALTLNVYSISSTDGLAYPLVGAYVDLWHCDSIGAYSDEASGNIQSENTVGQTWLRGYQVTDSNGSVTFDTIFPGWYTGRTTHFHLKIRTYNESGNVTHEFITQLFMTDALTTGVYAANSAYSHGTRGVYNTNDNVYTVKNGGVAIGNSLTLSPTPSTAGSATTGYAASFNVAFVLS